MTLIFLIHGRIKEILKNNNLEKEKVEIIKIDDKDLSSPKFIINKIKLSNCNKIYFATKKLKYQRFQTIMKLYILIALKNGSIIDSYGTQNKHNLAKLLFIEIPLLGVELLASIITYLSYSLKIKQLHKKVF